MSAEQDLANANVQIANLISEVTRFRDAAMGINNLWPTITEGRNNTADGKYFSVPGGGAYLKLYRRAGTSQTLIAEFPDRAQVQSLADTLGGRGVVGGPGDLMALGAIGLGLTSTPGNTQGLDFDNYTTPDVYSVFDNSVGGFANAPPPYLSNRLFGGLIVTGSTESALQQLFHSRLTNDNRVFCRSNTQGVWSPWAEIYNSGSILGTVSQVGGKPTGAVFERGSNSFWEWTKYADGRAVVSARIVHNSVNINTTTGSVFVSEAFIPPFFPFSFASIPIVTTDYKAGNTAYVWGSSAGVGSVSRPFDSYRFFRSEVTANANLIASITATGPWY